MARLQGNEIVEVSRFATIHKGIDLPASDVQFVQEQPVA